jgi:tetratricopeptide (TPR) repeat protein
VATKVVEPSRSHPTSDDKFLASPPDLPGRTSQKTSAFAHICILFSCFEIAQRITAEIYADVAAQAIPDPVANTKLLTLVGRICLWRNDVNAANSYLRQSELVAAESLNQVDKAAIMRLKAQIATAEGDYHLAQGLLTEIPNLAPWTADDEGRAATLVELGLLAQRQWNLEEAQLRFDETLRLDTEIGTVEGQAVSLSHLAEILVDLRDESGAQSAFERGLELAHSVQRLSTIGQCQIGLARLYARRSDTLRSHAYAKDAEETSEDSACQNL